MDASLEILVPDSADLSALVHEQTSFVWQGETFLQGDDRYTWGNFVEVVPTPVPNHLRRYTSSIKTAGTWIALPIRGCGLDMLCEEVNGRDVEWNGWSLEGLLRELLSTMPCWVLVFELHSDQIDSVYEMTAEKCVEHLKQNLRNDSEIEGFVVRSTDCRHD